MSFDLFEHAKDITRAYCEQNALPAPDNKPASVEAHALLDAANQQFVKEFGEPVKADLIRRAGGA